MIGNKDIAHEQFLLKITLRIITAIQHVILGLKWDLSQTSYIRRTKCFSYRLTVVFAQSIVAMCLVEHEDIVGAAVTGDTPTTSECSTIDCLLRCDLYLKLVAYIMIHHIQFIFFLAFIDAFCAGCASATDCSWISLKWNEIPGFRSPSYLTIRWVNMFLKIKNFFYLITTFLRLILSSALK